MDDADRMREAGDLWSALERYKAADQIMHVPTTGLEVARTQAQILQLVEASGTAIEVANSSQAPGEPALFGPVRKEALALANQLATRIPSLTVWVEPAQAPYSVSLDGSLLPDAMQRLPFKLNPGTHIVLVQAAGYHPISHQVSLAEAQRAELRLTLVPVAAPLPLAGPPRPEGAPPSAAQADDANAAGRTRGYWAVGIGGAVLVTGVITGILAVVEASDLADRCPNDRCPPDARSDLDGAHTLSNVANVTVPLGLLGVGYGLFEILTHADESGERASRSKLRVGLSLANPGLWMRGEL